VFFLARKNLCVTVLTAALAMSLGACGDDESSNEISAGNGIDLTFIEEMVPHHESAVDMAQIAQKSAEHSFVRRLADAIIDAQEREITLMQSVKRNLTTLKREDLGVPAHAMGTEADVAELRDAQPFDRQFIDMMIPHHQGAVRMARVELARGKSPTLEILARDIIASQSREIEQMNSHRKRVFGAVSPAGGVPPATESSDGGDHDRGGHDG
jgi:uncharacterized protein (DUF305 family)